MGRRERARPWPPRRAEQQRADGEQDDPDQQQRHPGERVDEDHQHDPADGHQDAEVDEVADGGLVGVPGFACEPVVGDGLAQESGGGGVHPGFRGALLEAGVVGVVGGGVGPRAARLEDGVRDAGDVERDPDAEDRIGDGLGLKLGKTQAPVRVAVTGRTVGLPLFESLEALGRDESLRRLRSAAARLGAA